ncbi:type II secretion system F family protein [Patescibacteria group bacterium]|jgi:type II secretory pathway component PulF|nr:type II secretion system F family protein [Patescibacteria group bacterium]
MPSFKYRARLPDGRLNAGIIEAESEESANQALQERGMDILLLEPYKGFEAASKGLVTFLNRISAKDLVIVTRTLSVMVSASVPLTDSVRNIARQTVNPKLRKILTDVANEVEGGGQISDAFEKYPQVFSGFFVNMVRSGETTGQLAEVLEYLADQQEKDYDLSAKLKGAMIYPAFILSAMGIVGFVMMSFVVPKLVGVLEQAEVELPIATRILISVSSFFESYWWLVLILTALTAVGVKMGISTPSGRIIWDHIKLRIPVFGKLFQRVYVVRFSRSLATLMKGGVDLVGALEIVAGVMENAVWKQLVFETIREVNDGNSLTTAFERSKLVPTMMVQMLAIGEATGKTQEILLRLSSFFSREVDNVVANLVALIEPLILIILGVGVGGMVSAILLPLYSLSSGG